MTNLYNDERRGYVYALRHNPTGKIYVGSTESFGGVENRVRQHIQRLKRGEHDVERMQEDCDRYGCDYSYFVLSETHDGYEARSQEKLFMTILGTRCPNLGYNYKDHTYDFSLERCKEFRVDQNPEKKKPGRKPGRPL